MTQALQSLIELHDAAWNRDQELWGILCDAEDDPALDARPSLKVQTGKFYKGRDDAGNDITEPMYSFNADEIRKVADRNYDSGIGLFVNKNDTVRLAERRARFDQWAADKIAELEALDAERKIIEDATGYTVARANAFASSDNVRAIEKLIVEFVPVDLAEAVVKAAWTVTNFETQRGYVDDDEENLINALKAIARATV